MSEANEGTAVTDTGTAEPPAEVNDAFDSFADTMVGNAPVEEDTGKPEQAEAVETSETEENAPVEPVTEDKASEETAKTEETAETKETPEVEASVNFDGFSDEQKTTWERLLKDKQATVEEVERARLESMFHSAFTKKTMALADEKREWAKEAEGWAEDRKLLEKIRGSESLHEAWMKMSSGDYKADTDADGDDLVDKKASAEIAKQTFQRLKAEEDARTAQEQKVYDTKVLGLREALAETMKLESISEEQLSVYVNEEGASLPLGTDPVSHFSPEDLQSRVSQRHKFALQDAKIKALEEKLTQKTSDSVRTAKQSSPPSPRVTSTGKKTAGDKTVEDLGLDQDWSNVSGFGNR